MRRYILLLVLPVPITALLSYYVSSFVHENLKLTEPLTVKDVSGIPDLQVKSANFDPEVVNLLASVEVRKKEEIPVQVMERPEKPPQYRVTFTYVGLKKNYAIINGMLFREGDPVSPDERVVKITREGVLLSGRWGERWLRVVE